MDLNNLAGFVLVASLLVMSPGPNGVLIAKTVPLSGRSAGFANIAGFVAAFFLHGALAVFGISLLLVQSAELFLVVKMVGAAYLFYIGFKALLSARKSISPQADLPVTGKSSNLPAAFIEGFLTNGLNPKVSMFYLAAFPQFMPTDEDAVLFAFVLVAAHAVVNLFWFAAMVMLFARISKVARGGAFQRWLKGLTGLVFIGFSVRLATMKL
ncbi:MAG: LysE family translocator [Cohaesibacteraceae bacterium]|nr:LysE family translocator [Cohaesibacteraceae bacterium]